MTESCPACSPGMFPSGNSLAMHLFKKDDSAHERWETYDEALEYVFTNDTSFTGGVSTDDDGTRPSPSDGVTDGPEPSETVEHETIADGSGLGLSGKPEPVTDESDGPDPSDGATEVGDDSDGPETVACPACGADTGETPDDLEDGRQYRCTECNGNFRWVTDR